MFRLKTLLGPLAPLYLLLCLCYLTSCTKTTLPVKKADSASLVSWQYEPSRSVLDMRKDAPLPETLKSDTVFGGFSGIEYVPDLQNPAKGKWFLITDGYSKTEPRQNSYLYRCDSGADGFPDWKSCQARALPLVSAESIRYSNGTQHLYAVTENDEVVGSSFHQVNIDGSKTTALPIQAAFKPDRGFESLALDAKNQLWSIREQPEEPSGSITELTAWDSLGKRLNTFSYAINSSSCATGENGISELLIDAEKTNTFLVLERCVNSKDTGKKNTVILYETSIQGKSLTEKKPLFNFRDDLLKNNPSLADFNSDNLESMTWGPTVNGKRTLVFISDDNFRNKGAGQQFTRFLVLKED